MKTRYVVVGLLFTATLWAGEGPFDLTRHSVDAGGVVASAGGEFELSGTIGQPDAAILSGEEFTLTGGFWFPLAPTDCNDDGSVDLFDADAVTPCLLGPSEPRTFECACYDADGDGAVDLRDISTLQTEYTGS